MPSWLELSLDVRTAICVDEAIPGGLNKLNIRADGSIEKEFSVVTLGGPVSSQIFNNASAIALAHYDPPAISSFAVRNSTYMPQQNFTFNLSSIDPERQTTSHIHQALLDPTERYMLFADLGADMVHVYWIDANSGDLVEHTPLRSKPGYGPRHGAFWSPEDCPNEVYLFVIHELSNRIVSYAVTYLETGGLSFVERDDVSTFGDRDTPQGAAAAEIIVTPDKDFVIASNRLGPIFNIPNMDHCNQTEVRSDSLVTFRPTRSGKLEFFELTPSGGLNPRHFSLNKDGSMVAVANQGSGNIAVYARDIATGRITEQVAAVAGLGELT
ncbi:putative isomerase YbhE [Setomelanomma holmii]|uniref:Isomerase YbhE n=1 Tax=Setomelanomma holmii TaxID=210430 RepID=A0A9P4HHL4_9PLEO|nr:putative isomerase YbhE [Setomelanomma holmii]